MGELLPYLRLLKTRGFGVASRELRARFIRENPVSAIRRLMDVCERHGAKFTFFIVGICAKDNPAVIEEILGRGHEIGCHGFTHLRFPSLSRDEMRRDLERALALFERDFGYSIKGFRAPYLEIDDEVFAVLAELGFTYSSSTMGPPGQSVHPAGITELPISVDDWEILIKDNGGAERLEEEMRRHGSNGACFLLHPWRVGQRRYVGALEALLEDGSATVFSEMGRLTTAPNQVYLSGDIGELSLWEVARRSAFGVSPGGN